MTLSSSIPELIFAIVPRTMISHWMSMKTVDAVEFYVVAVVGVPLIGACVRVFETCTVVIVQPIKRWTRRRVVVVAAECSCCLRCLRLK